MRGLFTAYTLRKRAQEKRTHDKAYRRRSRGKIYKSVIGNRPQANAIVLDKLGVEAKQPNSLGRSGKSEGDRPGIKYKIIKVAGVSLDAILRGKREKPTK